MPKTPTQSQQGVQSQNIIRAAAEEFAERGFAWARVDEIARRAGVNKAMLYYHVGDKAALYEKVVLDGVADVTAYIKAGLSKETTPAGKIMAIAKAFEALGIAKPYLPRIILREMITGGGDLPAPALEAFGRMIQLERVILEEAAREGLFRRVNPLTFHILIVGGTMLHLVTRDVRERIKQLTVRSIPEPDAKPAEAVSSLLLEGLLARPRRARAREKEQTGGPRSLKGHSTKAHKIPSKEERV